MEKDFRLNDDGDIIFTEDGAQEIDGAPLIAQDIKEEINIPKGSVFWDRDAGSIIPTTLNSIDISEAEILNDLERIAMGHPLVDVSSVSAEKVNGKNRLFYKPLDSDFNKIEIEE